MADVHILLRNNFQGYPTGTMETKLDASLYYEKNQKKDVPFFNKRNNNYSHKILKTPYGEFRIKVTRDHEGKFDPKLILKYQRNISGINEKSLFLYAKGMITRDIHN